MRKFFRSLRENFDKKKKKKMKTSSTKLGNESKAVCKNKNKSFHLFLRRKSASEGKWKRKRLSLTFFLQRSERSEKFLIKKNFGGGGKSFSISGSPFRAPVAAPRANCRGVFFCLLSFSFCACRWKGNFFKSRMKFYDAAFVFSSQSATVNGGEEKSARGGS